MSDGFQHRVRYHETDAQGFMFNSRYLEIADVAMVEFFRRLGFPYPELAAGGVDPAVVRAAVDFRRPARFDDLLDVAVTCSRVGESSFDLDSVVTRDHETIAEMRLTYVNVDVELASARPIGNAVGDALRAVMS